MSQEHKFIKSIDNGDDSKFGPAMSWIDTSSRFAFDKIAKAHGLSRSYIPPEFEQFIQSIKGKLPHNKVAFYNRALGCAESYGINNNGDCWNRKELLAKHATFVTDGLYFRDHANKRAIHPNFGQPISSVYNTRTDMVDLIILSDLDKVAMQDIQTLESGGQIFTSMGCRVRFDECLICGNKAPSPEQYCEHVEKNASWPYGMCQILEDGRVCGVHNPDPVFHDISRLTTRPAFNGSENLMKVAKDNSEPFVYSVSSDPIDLGDKLADMIKQVGGEVEGAVVGDRFIRKFSRQAPALPVAELMKVASGDFGSALTGSLAYGVIWSPDEYRAGVKIATGRDVGAIAWPKREDIDGFAVPMSSVVAWRSKKAVDLGACLSPVLEDRSLLQPFAFNRCQQLKTAGEKIDSISGHTFLSSDNGYLAYRAMCVRQLPATYPSVDVEKTAGTLLRTVSQMSMDMARGIWTRDSDSATLEKQASAGDTGSALFVTGSMLDGFGPGVLDQMAQNTLT